MALSSLTPQGEIYICANVGLDPSYTDTFTFTNKGAQEQFFTSKVIHFITRAGPVRPNQPIRVGLNSNLLMNADYLMFKNTNYGSKWFYAFITDISWVNVNECAISYEIDVVQTWYFEYTFPQMFIEREHTNDDTPGANRMEEGLSCGDLQLGVPTKPQFFNNYDYVIWATYNVKDGSGATFRSYGGIFSGLVANVYRTPEAVAGALDMIVTAGKGDAVVAVTMYPTLFLSNDLEPQTQVISIGYNSTMNGRDNGYRPRNNKLLTYPYRFLTVSNQEGTCATYKFEDFDAGGILGVQTVKFSCYIDLTPNPTAMLVPNDYLGDSSRWDYGVSMSNFPQCPWASDTYQAWLAQNSTRLSLPFLGAAGTFLNTAIPAANQYARRGGGITSGFGTLAGSLIGAATDALMNVMGTMATMKDMQVLPPQAQGSASSYTQISLGEKTFAININYCKREFAESLDSFFDMFGYKTNQVKTPNIHGRQSWNYVKTVDSHVLGRAPSMASARMEAILDSGIRFWHGDYIGQYARDNFIVPQTRAFEEKDENPLYVKLSGEYLSQEEFDNEQAQTPQYPI